LSSTKELVSLQALLYVATTGFVGRMSGELLRKLTFLTDGFSTKELVSLQATLFFFSRPFDRHTDEEIFKSN
jgi:hypothetical protein